MDRLFIILSLWRGPLPETCSYVVPSPTRVSLWIFKIKIFKRNEESNHAF